MRGTEKVWRIRSALVVLENHDAPELEIIGAIDLLSGFYPEEDEKVVEPLRHEMYHGVSRRVRERAAEGLAAIGSPAATSALESVQPGDHGELHGRIWALLASRRHKMAKQAATKPMQRASELDRSFEAETQGMLKRSEAMVKQLLEGQFKGDLLRETPIAEPALTVGGPGYRLDFEPKVSGAASFHVWVGIRSLTMGIGPRLPVRTVEWRTSLGQFSKEIDVDIDAEYVRKGRVDERFLRKTGDSVAQLGGRFSGSELSTSGDLPEIGDLPADWETVTYLPYA